MGAHSLGSQLLSSLLGTHLPGEYGVDLVGSSFAFPQQPNPAHDHVSSYHNSSFSHRHPFVPHQSVAPSYSSSAIASVLENAAARTSAAVCSAEDSPLVAAEEVEDAELLAAAQAATDALPAPPAPPTAPAEVVFDMDEKHQFRDFRPATFRKLRELCGITEQLYLDLVALPTKEKIAEGGSGAFFFYCGDGELIVKTVSPAESRVLLSILDRYLAHLTNHPQSFLARFLGWE